MKQVKCLGEMELSSSEKDRLSYFFLPGNDSVWKEVEGGFKKTDIKSSFCHVIGQFPEEYAIEQRFLRVEGLDGHTILGPDFKTEGWKYNFPMDDLYDQITKKIPVAVQKDVKFYSDSNHRLWIEDILKIPFNIDDSFYESIHLKGKGDRPVYLLKGKMAPRYWFEGNLRRDLQKMKNVKKHSLVTTILPILR